MYDNYIYIYYMIKIHPNLKCWLFGEDSRNYQIIIGVVTLGRNLFFQIYTQIGYTLVFSLHIAFNPHSSHEMSIKYP